MTVCTLPWVVIHSWVDDDPDYDAMVTTAHQKGIVCHYASTPLFQYPSHEWAIDWNAPVWKLLQSPLTGVVVVHSLYPHTGESVLSLEMLLQALRAKNVHRVVLATPFIPYGRQDKDKDLVQGWHTLRDRLQQWPLDRLITLDPHTSTMFSGSQWRYPVHTVAYDVVFDANVWSCSSPITGFLSPDQGSCHRAQNTAHRHHVMWGVLSKTRTYQGAVDKVSWANNQNLDSHQIKGHWCVVDDMLDTGNTLLHAIQWLYRSGASHVSAAITHGILSGHDIWSRLHSAGLRHAWITTSVSISCPIPTTSTAPMSHCALPFLQKQTWSHLIWNAIVESCELTVV